MDEMLTRAIKESLEEETPAAADAVIRAAMRRARPRRRAWWWAAAAGVAAAIGVGAWLYGREQAQQLAAMRDDADAMLEIIGMASVDDVYTFDTAQL